MRGLVCGACLIVGKRLPTKIDHVGDERFARHAEAIVGGLSVCTDHIRPAVLAARKREPR